MTQPCLNRWVLGVLAGVGIVILSQTERVDSMVSSEAEGTQRAAEVRPFVIDVPDSELSDLNRRLTRARFPDEIEGAEWTYGTNLAYLKELVDYWRNQFDWREQERKLNKFSQFKTKVDGLDVHFLHRRSEESNALPVIMIHGWPGTFFEFSKMVEPLADPVSHQGVAAVAFDVVVVSLPGYGFSEKPRRQGHSRVRTAAMFVEVFKRPKGPKGGTTQGERALVNAKRR